MITKLITHPAHPHRVDSGTGSVCQERHHLEPINLHLHEQTGEGKENNNNDIYNNNMIYIT